MNERRRGRPKKRRTVRVQALLYAEQKERLEFLSRCLPGGPPLTGLIREAVSQYIEKQFTTALDKAFQDDQNETLRIMR